MTNQNIKRPFWTNDPQRSEKLYWLDKNEITIEESQLLNEKIIHEIVPKDLSIYPNLGEVYRNIKEIFCAGEENTLLTTGADGAIREFFISLSHNNTVIKLSPTFAMIDVYPRNLNRKIVDIQYELINDKFVFNYEYMIQKIQESELPPLVILANPDSPTGSYQELALIKNINEIVEKKNGIFLIDGTYMFFKGFTKLKEMIQISINSKSLLFTLSLSKFPGLAGARLGLITGPIHYINQLRALRPMYEIGGIQNKILSEALKRWNECIEITNQININKNQLEKILKDNNYKTLTTSGNFTLFKSDNKLNKFLEDICHFRKNFNIECLTEFSRISTPPKKFINELETFLAS